MNNTFQEYRQAYRLHLQNNNLENDSEYLKDIDVFNYLIDHVDAEDRKWYGLKPISYCRLRSCEDITTISGTNIEIKGVNLPYKGSAETFRIVYNGEEYDDFSTAFDFYTI